MRWSTKYYFIVLSGLLYLFPGMVLGETLPQAVEHMIRTNPKIKAQISNKLARDEEIVQSRAEYFPKVDLQGGIGVEEYTEPNDRSLDPREVILRLRQNVFAGFQSVNEVDRQKARTRSSAYRLRSATDNIALQVGKVYLSVLKNQELADLATENEVLHERITDQVSLRSESGVSRKVDFDQVEGRLALAKSNTVIARINLVDAQTNYQAIVGRVPIDLTMPEAVDSCIPESLDTAKKFALENHPTLLSANTDLTARKIQNKVARANFWPQLDLEVDKYWGEDVDGVEGKTEYLAGWVRLRYNLFNGWNDKARKNETVYLEDEAREIRNNTGRQVLESIELSWMANQAVTDRIKYLEQRVASASATSEAYAKQFNIGQRTLLDVLDTSAELIDAKKDLISAKYDRLTAQFRILNGMGNLTQSLGLAYPEEALVGDDKEQDYPEEESDTGKDNG